MVEQFGSLAALSPNVLLGFSIFTNINLKQVHALFQTVILFLAISW